jgi:hypothetical protein
MRQVLQIFPGSHSAAVTSIAVDIAREPHRLLLHYFVTGQIANVRIPPVAASARTDELWQHTCFEAFLRPEPTEAYWEFNFAPSTQWAAYGFSAYRKGMRTAGEVAPTIIDVKNGSELFELQVALDLTGLPETPRDAPWRLNVSAVIEEKDGHKSYWALAHPAGRPNFHDPDCFALELPPA